MTSSNSTTRRLIEEWLPINELSVEAVRERAGAVPNPAPLSRQSLPEGRRHPEGVVSGNPLGPEMTQFPGPLQHLQGQLRLRAVAPPLLRHTRRRTAARVRSSTLGQIQPFVHQRPAHGADVGQKHPGLAAGHLAQPATASSPLRANGIRQVTLPLRPAPLRVVWHSGQDSGAWTTRPAGSIRGRAKPC